MCGFPGQNTQEALGIPPLPTWMDRQMTRRNVCALSQGGAGASLQKLLLHKAKKVRAMASKKPGMGIPGSQLAAETNLNRGILLLCVCFSKIQTQDSDPFIQIAVSSPYQGWVFLPAPATNLLFPELPAASACTRAAQLLGGRMHGGRAQLWEGKSTHCLCACAGPASFPDLLSVEMGTK